MDLKIKDLAELLNVSETTIRRWLKEGKIPAYCINQQYRFGRTEIEDWVLAQKLEKGEFDEETSLSGGSGGNKQFSLYRAIYRGGILSGIPGNNKEELIPAAMKRIANNLGVDADVISEMLLEREALQSTALNNGIAIPHTRDFLLNAHYDMVTVVFPEKPLPYDALDGKPVTTLFFLFASDDKRHLHLLAKIAHLSSHPETMQFLQSKPSKEKILEYIKEWESGIQQAI